MELKVREASPATIALVASNVRQNIVFALQRGDETQFAVAWRNRVLWTAWMKTCEADIPLAGQPSKRAKYTIDQGRRKGGAQELFVMGERNAEVELSQGALLENIRKAQSAHDIPQSKSLAAVDGLGACALDVEMETGTGKTYVYIKTMHELHKFYGWSKFIVVVPSVAIREGVKKSFEMLEEHFMECYGEKARFFVYSSGNLAQIDSYSSDARLNVMIINMQAFARSFKEGANNSEALSQDNRLPNDATGAGWDEITVAV